MKNTFRLLAAALTLFTASFATPALAQKGGKTGEFHTLNAPTTGTATLSKEAGKSVLKLTNLKTEVGPGLQVWLYAADAPAKGAKDTDIAAAKHVVVGDLKTFTGDFSFALPAGTKASDYKSVVLWCENVKTSFAAAPLK